MQQTEKYQLNLIETSDVFSPDALNDNTQRVEDALAAQEDQADRRMDGLDARVTVLEANKIVFGAYCGPNGYNYSYDLGFAPKALILCSCSGTPAIVMTTCGHEQTQVQLTDTGFFIASGFITGWHNFIAFA